MGVLRSANSLVVPLAPPQLDMTCLFVVFVVRPYLHMTCPHRVCTNLQNAAADAHEHGHKHMSVLTVCVVGRTTLVIDNRDALSIDIGEWECMGSDDGIAAHITIG
jgi:hypothetical protein